MPSFKSIFRFRSTKPKKIPGLKVESKQSIVDREVSRLKQELPTKRSAQLVLDIHDLSLFNLEGKTVLDVGSGESDFVTYLRDNGISAKSLDPSKWLSKSINYPIAVEELKAKDKFDVIVCNYSFFYWSNNSLMIRIGFYRMLRALKANGYISLYPSLTHDNIRFFNEQRLFEIFRKSGFNLVPFKGGVKIYKVKESNLAKLKKMLGLEALPD
jgi:2-polyprenyl-3-methyl-5-hydroxy-6-metoxy-1,4-benzoquinol methylase